MSTPYASMSQLLAQISADAANMRVDQVHALLRALAQPVAETETLPLHAALGRVLAADVHSPVDVPPHNNSAMDGYAFAGCALGTVPAGQTLALTIVGTALAGQPWDGTLQAGQAVRIMTGAVIPAGADTVVAQEQVTVTGTTVTLPANGLPPGTNVRLRGEDLAQGHIACPKASPCTPPPWAWPPAWGWPRCPWYGVCVSRIFRRAMKF